MVQEIGVHPGQENREPAILPPSLGDGARLASLSGFRLDLPRGLVDMGIEGEATVPDDEYVREQKIPKASLEQWVFLANLSPRQFLGFVYQNLGVLHSQRSAFVSSADNYAWAIARHPRLAAAYYNRGNDELKLGRLRLAIRDYTKALELYPTDVWALHNRGLVWKGLGRMEKAEEDWKRVQEIEPGFKMLE